MATQYYALNEEHVRELTNILAPDIIESPVVNNLEKFNDLYIRVIEDTEFERTQFIFRRKGGEARRYKAGTTLKSTLGFMEENKLIVYQAWARYEQNLQNFREKQPFSILGSNKTYDAPASEFIIRNVGKQFAGDVLSNLFFGDIEKGYESPLGLYNGYWTLINSLINSGAISEQKMNLVKCDEMDDVETDDGENYDIFVRWIEKWHPLLRSAAHVVVYMSPEQKRRIIHSYFRKFTGLQTPQGGQDSFRLLDMPNIELKADAIIGKGTRMIATVPNNLEFGLDQTDDWNAVRVDHDQNDFNVLIFQIQSTQGCRILDWSGTSFAVSDGTITDIAGLNGDYQKNSITAVANDASMGKVTLDPAKDEYTQGETVKLTPAAESGYEFDKWSDGSTDNPRNIVFDGTPMMFQAIFKATE